jgi:hypothetical protein
VGHAVGRTLANVSVALGALAMPHTYSAMCKIRLGLWGEVLLHPLSEAVSNCGCGWGLGMGTNADKAKGTVL